MSRSYKKNPVIKDSCGKSDKASANRRLRRHRLICANGSCYKKINETYNIHEQIYRLTLKAAISDWHNGAQYLVDMKSEQDVKEWFMKTYLRK